MSWPARTVLHEQGADRHRAGRLGKGGRPNSSGRTIALLGDEHRDTRIRR